MLENWSQFHDNFLSKEKKILDSYFYAILCVPKTSDNNVFGKKDLNRPYLFKWSKQGQIILLLFEKKL